MVRMAATRIKVMSSSRSLQFSIAVYFYFSSLPQMINIEIFKAEKKNNGLDVYDRFSIDVAAMRVRISCSLPSALTQLRSDCATLPSMTVVRL
jgi:hypothetical protein